MYSVDYVFTDILEPHQQIRIQGSLGLEDDPSGAGYNVNQSKIAIGSGGLTGKGFLNGTQTKLKYVPEQDTDFIFCTVGEEQGSSELDSPVAVRVSDPAADRVGRCGKVSTFNRCMATVSLLSFSSIWLLISGW